MSNFTMIVIIIMIALAAGALLLLSGVIPGLSIGGIGGGGTKPAALLMWGDIPAGWLQSSISAVNEANKDLFSLKYEQKDPATYESELINALAGGEGPDIFFISQDLILKHKDKVFPVAFASFPERTFKDTFIQEGELFFSGDNIIAFPFIVDPMTLYWNRDLFSSAGIASPPKSWDELVNFVPKLTRFDSSGNIIQAGAALGEFQNIDYAKDIISLLILQTNNPIVDSASLTSTLSEQGDLSVNPAESAIRFFIQFSDPAKTSYSWNRSLAGSKNSFIAGVLGMYFGYASEYKDIAAKNPHLNFDVSAIPQIQNSAVQATFAKMRGLAISKTSPNAARALTAVSQMVGKDFIASLTESSFLPPVRNDLLAEGTKDPTLIVFYKAGIQSRAWLEPGSNAVFSLFENMIESVKTGKRGPFDAVSDANRKLDSLLLPFKAKEKSQ